jgi:hypothetical protein
MVSNSFWRLSQVTFICLMIAFQTAVSQPADDIKGATPLVLAKNYFDIGDYRNAMLSYARLLSEKPDDDFLNYRVGLCHLRQNIDKSVSIKYLRKVVGLPKFDNEALYDLGLAYMYNEQIDSALLFFNKYRLVVVDPVKTVDVTRQVEFCNNAKKFMATPLNVTFQNLGKEINSNGPDFNPMVPLDQSFLLYNTKRDKGVMGNNLDFDGYKPPDIFSASMKGGEFVKGKTISPLINTVWVEELAGISAYGEHMFYMIDNMEVYDDIYLSVMQGRSWSKPESLGPSLNTEDVEQAASCTPDGQTLFFSRISTLEPGFGELDIYMARKLPTGAWGLPVNLGPTVNTQYNESFPLISHDGKTLYFCSQGHRSMGGYDIFKSTWNESAERWERPENLGYPINTTMDNFVFSITDDPRVGYTSQLRPGGMGDLDVYRVIFNDVEERLTAVVFDFELMNSPQKEYVTIHEWKGPDGQVKWFPDVIGFQPSGMTGYEFVETKQVEVKDGESFEFTIIGSSSGGQVGKYDEKTFPKGAPFELVDMRFKKNKVPTKGLKPILSRLKDRKDLAVSAVVYDDMGKRVGRYMVNCNTGRMLALLTPGKLYEFVIKADGFATKKEKVAVLGMGDYKELITRSLTLVEAGYDPDAK